MMVRASSRDEAGKGRSGAVAPAAFADASNTVGLLAVPQPGSVAPEAFHGENVIPSMRWTAQSKSQM